MTAVRRMWAREKQAAKILVDLGSKRQYHARGSP